MTEDYRKEKIRSNSGSEFSRNCLPDEYTDQAYDTYEPKFTTKELCRRRQDLETEMWR